MEGISEAVAAIEHELDEIASRSQKVKAAVREFSASASSSSAKKAQEPRTNGESASPLGENPKVPIALQRFWRAQQERVVPAGSNVASISTEKKRKLYSLYGIWEELNSRAEDVQMRYQSTSRSRMNLFMHEEVKKEKQAEHALTCLHRTLMDPHSTARLVWSFVGLLCVIFDAFSIPVIVSWEIPNSEVESVLIPMMLYWTVDIGASAQTGFYENGLLVQSPARALTHYLRTWFLFDVAVVTFDWVMLVLEGSTTSSTSMGVGGRVLRVARVVRIVRLLRLVKLQNLLQVVEDSVGYAYMQGMQLVVAVAKALLLIVFSVHVLGCFWFMVGKTSEENGLESWLTRYSYHSKGQSEQYLACCHWILGQFTPAPMAIHAWNATERAYNVFVIFFSLLVVASCISRVSATIQQVIKLNSEAGDRKRQVAMYLKINKISSHLCIRVLRFVDHSLRKHKAAPLDSQLLSQTLVNELHMDRRGPVLRKHAMYSFLEQLSQRAFTQLCGHLELTVFEDKEIMFTRFSEGRGMYMPGPGQYQEEVDSDVLSITLTEFEFWAEISLFTSFQHTCTMVSVQFNDTFLLPATALAKAIQEFPECCGYVYQYARCLQSKLNAEEFLAEEVLSEPVRKECCEATDAFQLKNLTKDRLLQFFFLPKPYPSGADTKGLIRKVLSGELTSGEEIIQELERLFPELRQTLGTHALFSSENERHRALSCMLCVFWLATDRFDEFVKSQAPNQRVTKGNWKKLQDFVTWIGIRDNIEWIHGMLVYLAVKGLGRSKNLTLQLPSQSQQPDAAVTRLLERSRNVVPSVLQLDEGTLELLISVSSMHECFMFGQFLQAENTPLSLQLLQQKALENNDVPAYKLFLFSALAMMTGIGAREGCTGSPFLNDVACQSVLFGLEALRHLQARTCQEVYWSYLCSWGLMLDLPSTSLEDLALLRFACICRTRGYDALRSVLASWASLDAADRESITEFFLADGIHYHACLFSYLPDCFAHAHKNTRVGLDSMLTLLVELVEITWTQLAVSTLPHQVTVNLADLAAFTMAVRSRSVFFSCLEHAKITNLGNGHYALNMTSKNWSRTEEVSNHDLGVSRTLRKLVRNTRLAATSSRPLSQMAILDIERC